MMTPPELARFSGPEFVTFHAQADLVCHTGRQDCTIESPHAIEECRIWLSNDAGQAQTWGTMTERNWKAATIKAWSDAKQEQPLDFESVICWGRIHKADKLNAHEGFFERGRWFTIRGGKATFYEVTHWMPMPEGPK